MKEEKVLTREEVKQEMLEYIEHKYNEEFEVYGTDYKSWGNGGIETMLAYPKGGNSNYYFHVRRYGENDIKDDYVLFTMGEIYEKKATEIVKSYFPEAVIQTGLSSSSPIPDSFMPNMKFEKFKEFADKKGVFSCTIYLVAEKEEDVDVNIRKLLQEKLQEISKIGMIIFIGYSKEDFNKYILNDPYDSDFLNNSYSTNGETFYIDMDWGQVDFDYKYEEN